MGKRPRGTSLCVRTSIIHGIGCGVEYRLTKLKRITKGRGSLSVPPRPRRRLTLPLAINGDTRRSTGRMWSTLGSSSTRRNLECSRLQAQQCRRSSRADLTIFLPAPNKKSGGGCSIPSYPMVANLVPPPPPEASTARRVIFLSYFSRSTPWHGGDGPGSTTGDLGQQERADSRDTFRRVRSILGGPITRPHMWLVEAQHPELVTHGPEYFIGPFLPQP